MAVLESTQVVSTCYATQDFNLRTVKTEEDIEVIEQTEEMRVKSEPLSNLYGYELLQFEEYWHLNVKTTKAKTVRKERLGRSPRLSKWKAIKAIKKLRDSNLI